MPWTFIRPADPFVLDGRPLLDLGTGDAQTSASLVQPDGLVVGVDRSLDALRAATRATSRYLLAAQAHVLPFADRTFATVLAADLFHHLPDDDLTRVMLEVRRVLEPGGRLVAWWYEQPGRSAPDAPAHPRPYVAAERAAEEAGYVRISQLELVSTLDASPPTVGLTATV